MESQDQKQNVKGTLFRCSINARGQALVEFLGSLGGMCILIFAFSSLAILGFKTLECSRSNLEWGLRCRHWVQTGQSENCDRNQLSWERIEGDPPVLQLTQACGYAKSKIQLPLLK